MSFKACVFLIFLGMLENMFQEAIPVIHDLLTYDNNTLALMINNVKKVGHLILNAYSPVVP